MNLQRRYAVRALAGLSLGHLTACATAPSQRLDAPMGNLGSLRVYVHQGIDRLFDAERFDLFVKTLRHNGVPITLSKLLVNPFLNLVALEREWVDSVQDVSATHALVLTQVRIDQYSTSGSSAGAYVRYEAVLWSANTKVLVWKGLLASLSNNRTTSWEQRIERIAGDVIRALASDHVIGERSDIRSLRGDPIPKTLLPLSLAIS